MRIISRLSALALTAVFGSACLVAAAGAGAGTAVYVTSRGVESVVDMEIADVERRARNVLQREGINITETKSEEAGTERSLGGSTGDLDVTVDMEAQDDGFTRIEVRARETLATWDKEYARRVLQQIVNGDTNVAEVRTDR